MIRHCLGSTTYNITPNYSSSSFVNVIFFNSSTFFISLQQNSQPTSSFTVQLYNLTVLLSQATLSTTPLSSTHDKMIYSNDSLYLSFQNGIEIYQITNSFSLLKNYTVSFANTSLDYTDMSVDNNFLCYSTNFTLKLLYLYNYTLYWSINMS
jgi:hypothetical protein